MTYRLHTQVKPLIWVEAVVERHKGSRIEYMVKTRSQFKSRSVANNVDIIIPVPRMSTVHPSKPRWEQSRTYPTRMPSFGQLNSSMVEGSF